MTVTELIVLFIGFSILLEAFVKILKMLFPEINAVIASVVSGIFINLFFGINAFSLLGATAKIILIDAQWSYDAGFVIAVIFTGALFGGGSGFIHDVIKRIRGIEVPESPDRTAASAITEE